MRVITTLLTSLLLCAPAHAAVTDDTATVWAADPGRVFDAADVDLAALQWIARPVVVFADAPEDPSFIEQLEQLQSGIDRLVERDVIVIVDTDPAATSDIRQRLRPRGFMMVLIGKDGEINLRKPLPLTVREISRTIDKMPMRQREMSGR